MLQVLQFVLFIYVFGLPLKPTDEFDYLPKGILRFLRKNNMYIMYAFTLIYSYYIPAIATVHWLLNWNTNTDPNNLYKAWNLCYPLCGICNMFYYYTVLT